MSKQPYNIALLYNSKKNNNSKKIAQQIKKQIKNSIIIEAEKAELKEFEFIFIIVSNIGDEEIPKNIENYILKTKIKNKNYFLCELGNYLGLDYSGCGIVIEKILDKKDWKIKSRIFLDSFPELEMKKLEKWIEKCKKIIEI